MAFDVFVTIMVAQSKRIVILINKTVDFSSWCFLKEVRKRFSVCPLIIETLNKKCVRTQKRSRNACDIFMQHI